ncbi:unnamed protein product [Rotaria socialis]|uniref:Reverse transcriptase domain-containing protein n=1 Tax=Rotaria socialis TaxID=392032 RepID=A0A820SN56_9BILA|nr:unnamed protein product [Rotaria socialis]CAF4455473.1 unnamed protein product [Rotaria socialis]
MNKDYNHQVLKTINEKKSSDQPVEEKKRRKKCHGNRKVQRFRKKCRARGMKPHNIERKIKKRFGDFRTNQPTSIINKNDSIDHRPKTIITLNQSIKKTSIKRKREPVRSLSQFSISQPEPKKVKKKQNLIQTSVPHLDKVYRVASYLKRIPRLLIQTLGRQLDHPIKTKSEHKFIYSRLKLLDQQFCLNIHQSLWQSYFDLGYERHQWPDYFYKITKTNELPLCEKFVQDYLTHIQQQLEQCTTQLNLQATTCPETLTMTLLDHHLKEYISSQQKRFTRKIYHQLKRFKDAIHKKRLHHILFDNNLTSDQKEAINRLIHLRETELQIRKELLLLEQRILSKLLPVNFDQLDTLIASDFYTPALEDQYSLNYKLKRSKILQETKRTWLDILMESYDVRMKECNRLYQELLTQLELDISNHQDHHHDVRVLCRTVQAYIKHRTIQIKKDTFQEMASFHGKLTRRRQRSKKAKQTIGVSPEVILNVNDHSLAMIGHEYLSRHGNYIRPNRTALRSYKERVKIVQEQHEIMINQTKLRLTEKCHINAKSNIFKQFSERLQACLMLHYMTPLPFIEHLRAQRDLQTMKLIRRKLKKNQLLLRETDKGGNLYVAHLNEFEEKAADYRLKTGAYEELSSSPIEEILNKVTRLLNDLHAKPSQLSPAQYKKMIPSRLTVELAYMYYNPKTHKNPITLRPIMNTIHAATTGISRFLDQSIRPLFDKHAQPRPIIDGGHLLRQLEQYVRNGHLKPTTLFCTADITNLYTMLPQDESLKILKEFLLEHHYEKVQGIPIGVILQLADLVLKETAFVDGNKFYRQIIGGAMGSPFTLTLANIFMWNWEKNAICDAIGPHEIYGRYIDDIFFTFNEPKATIEEVIKKANAFHPNIKLEANIGSCVSFLDLLINNKNGILFTSVYHKPAAEPCVVPFISDHPRHVFSNIIQAALLRAVRYSTTLDIFEKERRAIRLMLLYNGYPSRYIDTHFRKFFGRSMSKSSMIPFIGNDNQFLLMRNTLLPKLTVKERETQHRIAAVTYDKEIDNHNTTEETKTITSISKQNKANKFTDTLFLHYTHEKRLHSLKRDIHKIYSEIFQHTIGIDFRLIVGHRNHRSTGHELVQKRPPPTMLKPTTLPSKIFLLYSKLYPNFNLTLFQIP